MNSGMGTLLTDSSAFAGANLLPPSLGTTLDDVKTKFGTLNLATLQNAVSRIHCDFFFIRKYNRKLTHKIRSLQESPTGNISGLII